MSPQFGVLKLMAVILFGCASTGATDFETAKTAQLRPGDIDAILENAKPEKDLYRELSEATASPGQPRDWKLSREEQEALGKALDEIPRKGRYSRLGSRVKLLLSGYRGTAVFARVTVDQYMVRAVRLPSSGWKIVAVNQFRI